MPSLQWLAWTPDAFERARTEDKPVLLSITATWSPWCLDMDRTSYADPEVLRLIDRHFVPIRVDAERRPDIAERYGLGGWPTTAFLTADGDVIGGGTYVPLERMPGVLEQVARAFSERRDEIRQRSAANGCGGGAATGGYQPGEEELTASIYSSFDAEHGGFGREAKFPLTMPLELALQMHREHGTPGMATIVETTLDGIGWGALFDEVDGGFFRCASTRDWQRPQLEKLLEINASLLGVFIDGAETLDVARYGDRARDVLRYTQTWLADQAEGGWCGSQQADADYYARRNADDRHAAVAPPVDSTLYADKNAAMISAALRAGRALDDSGLGEFAIRSLERLLVACYKPAHGVAHYVDSEPRVRGLLDDQVAVAVACLDAHEATGNIVYEMMAEELAHFAIRTLWDEPAGGFFDRTQPGLDEPDVSRLRARVKPFVPNCEAARMLFRVGRVSGNSEFGDAARRTLAAMARDAGNHGPLASHYLVAVREGRIR
jgi:uncharacterized protein YyaL (SSP411 family)